MGKYLDEAGLGHLWTRIQQDVQGKIKAAVEKKADAIIQTAGPAPEVSTDMAAVGSLLRPISEIRPVQEGEGTPSLDNIRNISGWDSITLTHNGTETVQELPETVYGGSYDWAKGELTVTHKMFSLAVADMNNNETFAGWKNVADLEECFLPDKSIRVKVYSNVHSIIGINTLNNGRLICFDARMGDPTQSEFKAQCPDLVCQFVFPLLEPRTIQLTPREFLALSGANTLSSDCGDTSLTFSVDLEKYIDGIEAAGTSYEAGDGIEITGNEISVETPIIPVTRAEYDALSEEEREGKLYLVTDAQTPKLFPQGMTVYSEEETVIGAYNGKPVYRKMVRGKTPTSGNVWSVFAANVFGKLHYVDELLSINGVWQSSGESFIPLICHIDANRWMSIYYAPDDDRIGIVSGTGYTEGANGIATLIYTKAEDVPGSIEVLPAGYVHSYDTEGGWHVRKYSDGYVEMEMTITSAASNVSAKFLQVCGNLALPITLLTRYGYSAYTAGIEGVGGVIAATNNDTAPETHTPQVWINVNGGTVNLPNGQYRTFVRITGRWK